jgi:DNA-binding SARP family transcriptional activator/tetratricopeptide (TPR) repeat protein/DNA-binding XRE family transcriptional regulator
MGEAVISAVRGDRLRLLRLQAGLTQPQLAKAAGLSVRALRDIEQGRVSKPHPASLRSLADALDLDPAQLGSEPGLKIGVLGPLSVSHNGIAVTLAAGAQQWILGLLALEADRFVSAGEIADMLWGDQPPPGWRNRVHAHIKDLRQALEPRRPSRAVSVVIPRTSAGYRLRLPEDQIDSSRFFGLLNQAQQAPVAAAAVVLYQQALSCWRGQILGGDSGRLSDRPAAEALRRAKLTATLRLADATAEAGQHDQSLFWLSAMAEEDPLHEGVHRRLMAALAQTGQQDKALRLYRDLRDRLVSELGVDPSARTQAVHRAILEQGGTAASQPRPAVPRPAQLPMAPRSFAGRDEVIALLAGHLTTPERAGQLPSPRVVVVHGMPGVGKTSLALQVAHRLRRRYPDGQLFADLQGEREHPAQASEIAAGFLRALGVAGPDIPDALGERSSVLRSYLAGRRMLMVLDDAKTAAQVLPLLPADLGNDVLVTSREPLAELPVTRLQLEPLTMAGSLAVLAEFVGGEQLDSGHAAAVEVAGYCAGLPLALRIAAARLHEGVSLPEVASLLADARQRIGELHSGQMAVRGSLESSVRRLGPMARAALARLALLPSRTIPPWTAEVALGIARPAAAPVLAELTRSQLLAPGYNEQHYVLHDLVKLYARETVSAEDRASAQAVVVQWFHLADSAGRRLSARMLGAGPLGIGRPSSELNEVVVDPHTWFDGEHRNLIHAIEHCGSAGQTRLAAGLLNALSPYFRARALYDEWRYCLELVFAAAAGAQDSLATAFACESATWMHIDRAELTEAVARTDQGFALFTGLDDGYGRCQMLYHRQFLQRRLGDTNGAMATARSLVAFAAELGHDLMLAAGHQALGVIYREYLEDLGNAATHLETALAILATDPMSREHSQVSTSLATVYIRQNRHELAEALLIRSLDIMRAADDQIGIIYTLTRLSYIRPPASAATTLAEALEIAVGLGRPEMKALVYQAFGRVAERDGDLVGSIRYLRQAAELHRGLESLPSVRDAEKQIARLEALLAAGMPSLSESTT